MQKSDLQIKKPVDVLPSVSKVKADLVFKKQAAQQKRSKGDLNTLDFDAFILALSDVANVLYYDHFYNVS